MQAKVLLVWVRLTFSGDGFFRQNISNVISNDFVLLVFCFMLYGRIWTIFPFVHVRFYRGWLIPAVAGEFRATSGGSKVENSIFTDSNWYALVYWLILI